jgi:alginate O-acetyltransferase complex protein AlgI
MLLYSVQLYSDFSGGMDMVLGISRMLGIRLTENFDAPYLSQSFQEFWRRWHMSLGGWFRDYVYIPLGGSRTTKVKWLRNVLIVWMLTGFWHGANWNFMLWGLYYGVLLLVEKLWLGKHLKNPVLSHAYVLLLTVFGFVLFHSPTAGDAVAEIGRMLGLGGLPVWNTTALYYLRSYGILLIAAAVGCTRLPGRLAGKVAQTRAAVVLQPAFVAAIVLLVTACLVDGSFNPFLYFRF